MKIAKGCALGALVLAAFLLMALVAGYVWFRLNIVEPYITFRAKEEEIVPQLDAQNADIAQTLPPLPPGASEDKRWSVGITNPIYDHGRWLVISISTTLDEQEVSTYYRENLLAAGWNEFTTTFTRVTELYYRGTSCLQIGLPGQYLRNYEIVIWHDFQHQSFSPPLPNLDYMEFAELGETKFATCPP